MGVGAGVPDWMLDLLLPRTDAGAVTQWILAGTFWLAVLWVTRRSDPNIRLLVWGLATVTVAWFLLRMTH